MTGARYIELTANHIVDISGTRQGHKCIMRCLELFMHIKIECSSGIYKSTRKTKTQIKEL